MSTTFRCISWGFKHLCRWYSWWVIINKISIHAKNFFCEQIILLYHITYNTYVTILPKNFNSLYKTEMKPTTLIHEYLCWVNRSVLIWNTHNKQNKTKLIHKVKMKPLYFFFKYCERETNTTRKQKQNKKIEM